MAYLVCLASLPVAFSESRPILFTSCLEQRGCPLPGAEPQSMGRRGPPPIHSIAERNCPKTSIGSNLEPQKSTKQGEEALFRCSGGQNGGYRGYSRPFSDSF